MFTPGSKKRKLRGYLAPTLLKAYIGVVDKKIHDFDVAPGHGQTKRRLPPGQKGDRPCSDRETSMYYCREPTMFQYRLLNQDNQTA